MFIEFSIIRLNFVQFTEFDWLPGQGGGKFSKTSKLFLETMNAMELKRPLNSYVISLYMNCVFIVVAHLLLILWQLRLTMEKVEIDIFCSKGIF